MSSTLLDDEFDDVFIGSSDSSKDSLNIFIESLLHLSKFQFLKSGNVINELHPSMILKKFQHY